MRYFNVFLFAFFFHFLEADAQQHFQNFNLDSTAHFRGVHAVSDSECWFSGSGGRVFRAEEEGRRIVDCSPKGYDDLDFRDIHAFGEKKAIILSAGLPAVILLTENGGQSWTEVYRNEKEGVFFDAMDFWDTQRGIAFSDAVDKKLLIIETVDGGRSWRPLDPDQLPEVHLKQGGFAASGSCLKVFGNGKVVIGLGGAEATLLRSDDYGSNWTKTRVPIDQGEPSKGIFSLDFIDADRLLAVGGDYRADSLTTQTIASSDDGGRSWRSAEDAGLHLSHKYRSCILALNPEDWLAISRTGASFTQNGGRDWTESALQFYSASRAGEYIWFSGSNGRIGRMPIKQLWQQR